MPEQGRLARAGGPGQQTRSGGPRRRPANRPVRIGNCSGFYGDRLSALAEMVTGGPIDVVTGDYLAEVTMFVLAKSRSRRPDGGYANSFLRQLEPVVAEIADRGIKVVVNAGGLDPAGLAEETRLLLGRLEVDLAVAHVEGDDLTSRVNGLSARGELVNLDTGAPLYDWGHRVLTANAYLGGFGVKAALDGGADIVVTGRVADASLTSGSAAWWWDWSSEDHDALAGAVVAGHVIECGAQATGGNFSGFSQIADLTHPGFPLAEVDRDGACVITKHEGTGGAVTVGTVTAQLLYEIGGAEYLNPDVVARMDTVTLIQQSADRVSISGVAGKPPPATTKVAVTGLGPWRNSTTVVLTGLDVERKVSLLEHQVTEALKDRSGINEVRFTRIGTAEPDPADQMAGSCMLQIAVDGEEQACGRAFSAAVVELSLASYPGIYFTDVPGSGSPAGAYWPGMVPQSLVPHVVVHRDGRREEIPAPVRAVREAKQDTGDARDPVSTVVRSGDDLDPPPGEVESTCVGEVETTCVGEVETTCVGEGRGQTVEVPLGAVVDARSGDKGGNANVGLWVSDSEAWEWLRATITTERFKELVPEAASLRVARHELPNLLAVNFVVEGLLDGGATEARRFDKQAKALGEWLRARRVEVPSRLVRANRGDSTRPVDR